MVVLKYVSMHVHKCFKIYWDILESVCKCVFLEIAKSCANSQISSTKIKLMYPVLLDDLQDI